MIFRGGAGLGKSFNTIKKLSDLGLKKGIDYEILSSYVTPLELYKFLYENRKNKIIILDDTMGFFDNKINIGIVLSALWGEGKRIIHYHSSSGKLEVPQSFIFESKIIWCVNELPKSMMESVKSRCFYHELKFTYSEKIKLMYEIAKIQEIPFELVDFIKENSDESTENMDFRLLWKINEIFKANPKEWKDIAIVGLNKDEKLILLKQLLKSCNSMKDVETKWCEQNKMCRKSFYNYKNKLEIK